MNGGQQRPAFGLSFDPRALTDLLQAPSDIRDLTLAYLQEVVNAERFGLRLTGDLEGYRKLFVDSRKEWRVVYGVRPAPEVSTHRREIHVVAVRPRAGNDVYDTVGARLGMARRPLSSRTHAARSRSPQLTTRGPVASPGPLPSAIPGLPRPAHNPSHHQAR
ncbi:hypothetical protein NLX86_25950 [Streptomyces sp. A3M-1-3]|uniref:hypothetical protein n=1 Tax=Streptomyces sp. A3M-1-3 TaxID=2962044 RepID=UPI0020B6EA23|nr:hypothetical protein [Streptomyces sp. A3M-1-3]MCP3821414.1 hypothetical protein [Streptomyces sp. A3M-1-3]